MRLSVRDLSNQLRAELRSILPLELLKMVEYEMESEDFQFVSHRNPGTNMCVYVHMYTIFC